MAWTNWVIVPVDQYDDGNGVLAYRARRRVGAYCAHCGRPRRHARRAAQYGKCEQACGCKKSLWSSRMSSSMAVRAAAFSRARRGTKRSATSSPRSTNAPTDNHGWCDGRLAHGGRSQESRCGHAVRRSYKRATETVREGAQALMSETSAPSTCSTCSITPRYCPKIFMRR